MSILIISAGPSCAPLEGPYDAAGFDAAWEAYLHADTQPPQERKIAPGGRKVYVAEDPLALSSARGILETDEITPEPLLNEVQVRSCAGTSRVLPVKKWLRKAASQRRSGSPGQPESLRQLRERADILIRKLEAEQGDQLLVTCPLFLAVLLDSFRIHNYVIQRSGLLSIQPWEKIIISRKDEHCGGCQHNCFLSNPGCGVGRDKAMRISNQGKKTI